jgi:hypothetical protein
MMETKQLPSTDQDAVRELHGTTWGRVVPVGMTHAEISKNDEAVKLPFFVFAVRGTALVAR